MDQTPLQVSYFPTDEHNFFRVPLLISGTRNAILVDGALTLSTGRTIAQKVKDSRKNLSAIFITCADPDFYFGLGPVVEAFPDAKVLAVHLRAST